MNLTNDSKLILFEMYNRYQSDRKCGKSRRAAKAFGSAQRIHDELLPHMLLEDIDDSLIELKRSGFISGICCDNSVDECALTDHAIVTMEQLPPDAFVTLAKFLMHFIP